MFREPEVKGFNVVKSSEEVLKIAPWLWAFNKIWARGFCCETGSVHQVTSDAFSQRLDGTDDAISEILFLTISDGILQVRQVPKLMRFIELPGDFGEPRRNPSSYDGSIAERIIMAIDRDSDWISKMSKEGKLTIPQVVIQRPGTVDRTSHFFIYQWTNFLDWETIVTGDVLRTILSGNVFQTPA